MSKKKHDQLELVDTTTGEIQPEKMPRVLNSLNYKHEYFPGIPITEPSVALPDQTQSLKEIIRRHVRGLPITGNTPIYNTDETTGEGYELPDLRRMDISEIDDMKKANQAYIEHQRAELTAQRNERERINNEKRAKRQTLWEAFVQSQENKNDEKPKS